MYGDFIEKLEEIYESDKPQLKEIEKKIGFEFKSTTQKEEYETQFSQEESFKNIKDEHKTVFFEDCIEEAIKREKENNKKLKKLKSRYLDHLYSCKYYKKPTISWEEVKKETATHYSYKDLNNEDLAREIFENFVKKETSKVSSGPSADSPSNPKQTNDSSEEDGLIREEGSISSRDKEKSHKVFIFYFLIFFYLFIFF